MLVWCAWSDALRAFWGSPRCSHDFWAEQDNAKKILILRMFPSLLLFRDVCEMSGDTAKTAPHDHEKEVPKRVRFLFAGFPCTAASNLNMYPVVVNETKQIDGKTDRQRSH